MKKPIIIIIFILLLIIGCGNYYETKLSEISLEDLIEKSKSIKEYYYEVEVDNSPIKIVNKTWVKDGRGRIESNVIDGDKLLATEGIIIDEKEGMIKQYLFPLA